MGRRRYTALSAAVKSARGPALARPVHGTGSRPEAGPGRLTAALRPA